LDDPYFKYYVFLHTKGYQEGKLREMDHAELIATVATLQMLDDPNFDPFDKMIQRQDYFKGFEEEEKEWKRKRALKRKREEKNKKK